MNAHSIVLVEEGAMATADVVTRRVCTLPASELTWRWLIGSPFTEDTAIPTVREGLAAKEYLSLRVR